MDGPSRAGLGAICGIPAEVFARFVVVLSDPSGEADGTVDREGAFATMDRRGVAATRLALPTDVPGDLREAITAMDVGAVAWVDRP